MATEVPGPDAVIHDGRPDRFPYLARGGVLVAAAERFGLPIHAIGVGEGIEDLRPFDPRAVARAIAGLPA